MFIFTKRTDEFRRIFTYLHNDDNRISTNIYFVESQTVTQQVMKTIFHKLNK